MISDLKLLLNHYDSIVCDLICKLCTHTIVRIQRPQSDNNWDNRRGWLWCEDHMCSWSVNALLRCSIKRRTLIASSSLEAPLPRAGWTEDVVQVLIASTYESFWSTCLGLFSTWMLVFIYLQSLDIEVTCLDSFMQRPSIHPYAYRTRIPLFTVTVTIAPVSLLLLLFCCCYYKLLLLINFCEQELFPGAAEFTTQLLRLASILCLPLCRINKLGNTTLEDYCDPLYLWVISRLRSGPHGLPNRVAPKI